MLSTQSTQFYSDGCSWVPDFWFRECCVAHDLGSSDLELAQCIANSGLAQYGISGLILGILIGITYFIGLKLFGWAYQLNKKRTEEIVYYKATCEEGTKVVVEEEKEDGEDN